MKIYIYILSAILLAGTIACNNAENAAENHKTTAETATDQNAQPTAGTQDRGELEMKKTQETINKYVADHHLDTQVTANGLVYQITKHTKGKQVHFQDQLEVKYSGYFTDGKVFDSGVYPFTAGAQMVIRGWDEAAELLREGEKATLIVPFWLAYGDQANGPIPPYSTLLFDIEVLKVTPAPQEQQ